MSRHAGSGSEATIDGLTLALAASRNELRAVSDEFHAVNEELRAASEEMAASVEAQHQLNKALHIANAQLHDRNTRLQRANSDLAHLFDSTAVATLFLDRNLLIRRFSRRVSAIFRIREGDEGRPIDDIATLLAQMTPRDLAGLARQVMDTSLPLEREVTQAGGGMWLMQIGPYRNQAGGDDGVVVSFIDMSERRLREQTQARLSAIVKSFQDGIISHDLGGIITSWNGGAEHLYGYTEAEAIGQPMTLLMDGSFAEQWPMALAQLRQGLVIARFDGVRRTKDGRMLDVAISVSQICDEDLRVIGASEVARDIGDRKAAERKTGLLLRELDHRVKNILAIVLAVVVQTLRSNLQPASFAVEIEGRIKAIAQAHSLLTEAGEGEMSLSAIFATELSPFRHALPDPDRSTSSSGTNIDIAGADVSLTPKAGLALAMAVHELASNAAKYGALSVAAGRIDVRWDVAQPKGAPILTLSWTESGGPPVQVPTRRGFGTTLIEMTLAYQFESEVRREFAPGGVSCVFVISLTEDVGRLLGPHDGEDRLRGH